MKITAVLTVKNEGAFLLEWLAHHRACGVTDFLVFSNDCSDGTDAMLDRLQAMGWLTHVPNPGPYPQGPQWAALKQADAHPLVRGADWLLPIDVDEFVNVHVGDRTIPALLAALPEATAIPLTWRLFGNAGVRGIEDRRVTESFTRASRMTEYTPVPAMVAGPVAEGARDCFTVPWWSRANSGQPLRSNQDYSTVPNLLPASYAR
ncbi:MAG: glycosyltransferase family 2 protein [Rhodobacteraceae bacterium]|nr:glycosyltransferase family 2 protein [Paracoccaceae bacterium]